MSAESSRSSRPPQSNSAPDGTDADTAESVSRKPTNLADLPDPAEKVREFLDEFGERAHVPMSTCHGRALRPECFEEDREVSEYVTEDGETESVEEVVERRAVPLWQAVANMLEWHEDYHKSTLRLEYGRESDPTHELLDIDLENSWFAAYQDKERAKLKALERETCGFERCDECDTRYCSEPDEHETEYVSGVFEEPVVALTGRTASGAGRPPVDHARDIAEAWSDGEVRRSLRYILDERLGLESDEWVRWTQGEPHPGDGENRGYHHAHDIIILDGAAAEEEVTAATFRTMIEAHVAECDHAGPRAHDLDASEEQWRAGDVDTVSVKRVEDGDIKESVASYAAAYLANEKVDLLERSPEYLMWAATMWATETQKGIKSDSANHAIEADKCRHKHHSDEQELGHGEQVTRKPCRCANAPYGPGCSRCDGRGFHVVCMACGSPWEVEQAETLVEARRVAGPGEPDVDVVADGGRESPETAEEEYEQQLRERWPSAREVASVGGPTVQRECDHEEPDTCPLCATETESPNHTVSGEVPIPETAEAPETAEEVSVAFERPPSWSAKCIIRDGEEIPATGGTSGKQPLDLPSAPSRVVSMSARSGAKTTCQECGTWLESPRDVVEHGCDGDVYVWWVPGSEAPAEESMLSREEYAEVVPENLLTESSGDDLDGEGEVEEVPEERIRRYVSNNPSATVPEVLGKFGVSPDQGELVGELVD